MIKKPPEKIFDRDFERRGSYPETTVNVKINELNTNKKFRRVNSIVFRIVHYSAVKLVLRAFTGMFQ